MDQKMVSGQFLIALFTISVLLVFWGLGSKKPRQMTTVIHRRYYANPPDSPLNKPPSKFSKFLYGTFICIIALTSFLALSEWNEEIYDIKRQQHGDRDIFVKINDFLFTNADMGFEVGSELPHMVSPNGPWYWIGFLVGCVAMISGSLRASNRIRDHEKSLNDAEKKLRPILRRLAMDPNGVVEGRIRLPQAIPISMPGKKEERLIVLIYAILGLMMTVTFLSIGDYFNELRMGKEMESIHDAQAFILFSTLFMHMIAVQITTTYLSAEYEGEDDSILPPQIRRQSEQIEETRIKELSSEPATASDVLEALAREMEAAKAETAFLREELDETRNKVKGLEIELEEKTVELESIQDITKSMEKIVEENKDAGDKSLSLNDSVMVGDNLFNGDKIDKQIINDPEAIARAAIEAYREGRRDRGAIDLDFD